MADIIISPAEFDFIAAFLRDRCALVLEPDKKYLLNARLTPVAQRHGIATINELIECLRRVGDHGLATDVVEAMVTTETSFFRDIHPFETLRKAVLPQLIELRRRDRQLNIWFAASSSGQTVFSGDALE